MTKEEILTKNAGMLLERMIEEPDRLIISMNEALPAMQEYAEQEKEIEAILFTDWIVEAKEQEFVSKWYIDEVSTTELYKIFKQK